MDIENTEISIEDEPEDRKKVAKPPKSNTIKVGKRTAFVYTGAAILIVVVGMRTLLQMADEGFGLVEYITIGALMIEFSVLFLYSVTIYSVSKDDARKEGFAVQSQDMPAVAMQLQMLSQSVTSEIQQMQSQNDRLHALYNKDIPALSDGLSDLTQQFKNALDQIHGQQNSRNEQTEILIQTIADFQQGSAQSKDDQSSTQVVEKFLGQLVENDSKTTLVNDKLLEQLAKNEQQMGQYNEQILNLSKGIKEVVEEQVTLRIRQEIQHILSAPIVKRS